jgi:hypothetical protein
MKDGVIADFDNTASMRRYSLKSLRHFRFFQTNTSSASSRASTGRAQSPAEAAGPAGGRRVSIIEEPIGAAIGAGLPVSDAPGSMVVDIFGGYSEVAESPGRHRRSALRPCVRDEFDAASSVRQGKHHCSSAKDSRDDHDRNRIRLPV